MFYNWRPLEDLPEDWKNLASLQLASLSQVWREQREKLREDKDLKEFNARLMREWAIETGIIENIYSLSRGITQVLIEKGLSENLIGHGDANLPSDEVIPIIKDHLEVLEGLFDFVAGRRPLSVSYIKEMHAAMTRHQEFTRGIDSLGKKVNVPLIRGDWKKMPNNPSRQNGSHHEYCPPEQVASEMDNLIKLHLEHCSAQVPPEVEAAWLHHRFTQVHPFQDGNGRIARTLASLVFIRERWFPLVLTRDMRDDYIAYSEKADQGDISDLVRLFTKVQIDAFKKALSISEDIVRERKHHHDIIRSAVDKIAERKKDDQKNRKLQALEIFSQLGTYTGKKLEELASELNEHLQRIDKNYGAQFQKNGKTNDHWFRGQIVASARKLEYFADLRTYKSWIKLRLTEERQTDIIFSFHFLGQAFTGICAISAFLEQKDVAHKEPKNKIQSSAESYIEESLPSPNVICEEVFQFSYNEPLDNVERRYKTWFEDSIRIGLESWRRQL
ncbi:MAG: Fic family protein [Candidatus Wallbacteria bacterium]|nr:Fic family protein [Candidatus Wallbacteria bacterium]